MMTLLERAGWRAAAAAASARERLSAQFGPESPAGLDLGPAQLSFTLSLGAAFPAFTLLLEWWTHFCGQTFFDPIPSLAHVLLVASVPVVNLLVWRLGRAGRPENGPMLFWLNGLAVAVSGYYAAIFAPLLPLACVALLIAGMGLLPMAPAFSFVAALMQWRGLKRAPAFAGAAGYRWRGLLFGLALLLVVGLPQALTQYGMSLASSDSPLSAAAGVRLLRAAGSRDWMLRACYRRQGRPIDLLGLLLPRMEPGSVAMERAREIYFRVTGTPFNAVPAPTFSDAPAMNPLAEFDFDLDQGGEAVAGRIKGLDLAESRIDASLDSDAGLGYLEWVMEFSNASSVQREARAQIALPPGAFVSRATLWVNGEEREATIAARAKAREAYERVVKARRDPLLVTTQGPDRVMVQCFPIPSDGGRMKIRLGITMPLALESPQSALLRLPYLAERNFAVRREHSLWIEARHPLKPIPNMRTENPSPQAYSLRGAASDQWLADSGAVSLSRQEQTRAVWAKDALGPAGSRVQATLSEEPAPPPSRVVLVMDGSRAMAAHVREIAQSLARFPPGAEVAAFAAGEKVEELALLNAASPEGLSDLSRRVRRARTAGGCDNVSALLRAWDLAAQRPGSVILWIHGPQPVLLSSVEPLRQRWERRPSGPRLIAYAVEAGPNRALERLDGIRAVETLPRMRGTRQDLARLFAAWSGSAKSLQWRRTRSSGALPAGPGVRRASDHLARLWAHERALSLASMGPDGLQEALALSTLYRLVTPVSGAVVLETAEQYRDSGLTPVESGKTPGIPTIPEPETWVLAGLALALALWAARSPARILARP